MVTVRAAKRLSDLNLAMNSWVDPPTMRRGNFGACCISICARQKQTCSITHWVDKNQGAACQEQSEHSWSNNLLHNPDDTIHRSVWRFRVRRIYSGSALCRFGGAHLRVSWKTSSYHTKKCQGSALHCVRTTVCNTQPRKNTALALRQMEAKLHGVCQ